MALLLLSRVIGLLREMVVAQLFGQGGNTDTFYFALIVPDFLFYLIAGGVLQSSFTPVFIQWREEHGEKEAWKLCAIVCSYVALIAGVFITIGEVWAHPLAAMVVPDKPELWPQVARLTRVVLPAQIAFLLGSVLMGAQWAGNRQFLSNLGSSIYNLGIMLGGALAAHFLGPQKGIIGLTAGALIGAFVGNLGLQLWAVHRLGARLRPCFDWRHPGVRRVFRLALPVIFSLSIVQVDSTINRWFAGWLFDGAATALERGYRLMMVPVGIFGQAIAIGSFATLTELGRSGQWDEFKATLNYALRVILYLALPATVLLIVLREPVIRLVFHHGRFQEAAVGDVAVALIFFALGIVFWCAQQVVARAFQGLQDTRTPAWTGTVVTVVFVGLNYVLMHAFVRTWGEHWGHGGLALSTTLSAGLHLSAMLVLLRRRIGPLGLSRLAASGARLGGASLVAGAVAELLRRASAAQNAFVILLVAGGAAISVYVALTWRCDERRQVVAQLKRRQTPPGTP
jgi:putative peptidoglycan lipid II flippase